MSDIVAFLNARLDEDQAGALATTPVSVPGRWKAARDKHADDDAPLLLVQGEDEYEPGREDYSSNVPVIVYSAEWQVESAANLLFIARHDPARVLREVEAKRAIVALHVPEYVETINADRDEISGEICTLCDEPFPCDSLKLMAAPDAEHADFNPAWAIAT